MYWASILEFVTLATPYAVIVLVIGAVFYAIVKNSARAFESGRRMATT